MASEPAATERRVMAALGVWNLAVFAAWVVVPFVLAGLRWVSGWVYLGVVLAGTVAERRHVARANPTLQERRKAIGPGTKRWDLGWNALFWPLLASVDVVAG